MAKLLELTLPLAPAPAVVSADSDAALVRDCRQGDVDAFRQLYQRFVGRVRGTLFRLGDATQLDDLTQDVFLRIWTALPQLQQPHQLATWIYRITVNIAQDSLRSARGARLRMAPEAELAVQVAPAIDVGAAVDRARQVASALGVLGFEHRTVLVLHDLEGLALADIAHILGVAVGTVKSRLHYARLKARAQLEAEGACL